jgi:EAL domain-containing protein (putative c-di-GMP-specific phosphodiesterase class I)
MAEILERGLKEHNFEMYYQPIYSIKEDRFVSAEALIRLKDRDYGYVSPGIFIPAAEQSGFIDEIGNFVIESVYKFVSTHNLKRLGLSYIEVNLSVEQCLKEHFADYIVGTQNEYNVRPERINFEITETAYNSAKDVLDRNIKKLKARGYQFSLDDYGTGYSNMQRVLNLPLKLVKIDKSLVDDLDTENGASIVRNSIKMMQDIKLEVVIEGVETEEQLEILKSMGADYIQGFYFSRPLSELQFLEFLDRHNRREE